MSDWKPIEMLTEKLSKKLSKNKAKTVLYYYEASTTGRMVFDPVITIESHYGSRIKTHFMVIDLPTQSGERE